MYEQGHELPTHKSCLVTPELHHILWANAHEYEPFLISLTKTAVLNLVSVHTSGNPISFMVNLCISLSARGKCFLKPTGVDARGCACEY